ncbi:7-carboxy-7-deazaguanine synthase QueE [Actinoplanes sp. NPDC051859]|uniref:7-carboxy-7-deazaguanine synthase QueE n=1 Tax=Actinoplanes sp. NPDC051859 TaxID=3363909 RepID=UPI0037BBFCE1
MVTALAEARAGGDLLVAELFGPTVQGEGPSMGQRAVFVRLAGCHLSCTWCDTAFTWDAARYDLDAHRRRMPVAEVVAWVRARGAAMVVLTGGEPLLQQAALVELAAPLYQAGVRVEVETSGTVVPRRRLLVSVTAFNVSPKLANSGIAATARIRPSALAALAASGKAVFKFVAVDRGDLAEIAELEQAHRLTPIWVMPEGRTPEQVLHRCRELAEDVIARGWNLSTRLHVLLWGDQRGR